MSRPGAADELPRLDVLEAVLRETTERLALELSRGQNEPPRWDALEWRIARAVCALHGISALLESACKWRGPREWHTFLESQRHQSTLRERRARRTLQEIDARARARGVGLVKLKGSALLDLDIYVFGERPMGDLDLLARPEDMPAVREVLADIGYVLQAKQARHEIFAPRGAGAGSEFGEHIDNPLRIEVHCRVYEPLPVREVDLSEDVFGTDASLGLRGYPTSVALFKHLLLHASGNIRARALRFNQLIDIARVADRLSERDWREFLGGGGSDLWWAWAPLQLTNCYFPGAVPVRIVDTVGARCPSALKWATRRHCVSDVSWSNVRIQALPGIEWARSPWEAMRFMRTRLVPPRAELEQLRTSGERNAYINAVPWYGKSQLYRVVRWLVSHPPRVQTIHSIQAVLGVRIA